MQDYHIFADFHTHTLYSHGTGTVADNARAARERGLEMIAITDHGFRSPLFGLRGVRALQDLREEIRQWNRQNPDLRVLLGVEANVVAVDGTIDVDPVSLSLLDILLVGLHPQAVPETLGDGLRMWLPYYLRRWTGTCDRWSRGVNTRALIAAVERYEVDIVTHPGWEMDIDTRQLARACARRQTALEISGSHEHTTLEYIRIAREEGARFALGSDAHRPEEVGRLDRALDLARRAGLTADEILNARPEVRRLEGAKSPEPKSSTVRR